MSQREACAAFLGPSLGKPWKEPQMITLEKGQSVGKSEELLELLQWQEKSSD
jgi:hypothetical protein